MIHQYYPAFEGSEISEIAENSNLNRANFVDQSFFCEIFLINKVIQLYLSN